MDTIQHFLSSNDTQQFWAFLNENQTANINHVYIVAGTKYAKLTNQCVAIVAGDHLHQLDLNFSQITTNILFLFDMQYGYMYM